MFSTSLLVGGDESNDEEDFFPSEEVMRNR